jgi:hypothetical protein
MDEDARRLVHGSAWRAWCERLAAVGDSILAEGRPDTPRDRAEGYRWLTRLVVHALRQEVEAGDPLHPHLMGYETPDAQWGGPNPDNLYLRAAVAPGESYRVWGDVRGVRQAIFSLHEGDMQLGELGVWSETSLDALHVGDDGRLEILVSAERPDDQAATNWMPMHPKARLLTVRVYQSDWERDAAPLFHIERVGARGVPRPAPGPAALARALDRAASWVEASAAFWPRYTAEGRKRAEPNVPMPPARPPGGAADIRYGACFWELAPGEGLLLECERPDADYFGFTLHTLGWLESGDFAERQTSLNDQQLHADPDGRLRIVLAGADPGVPNWLDTEGRAAGMLVYRYVWTRSEPVPRARVLPLAQLRGALPAAHPEVTADQRREALARRREQVWSRSR